MPDTTSPVPDRGDRAFLRDALRYYRDEFKDTNWPREDRDRYDRLVSLLCPTCPTCRGEGITWGPDGRGPYTPCTVCDRTGVL